MPGHRELRSPGAVEDQFGQIVVGQAHHRGTNGNFARRSPGPSGGAFSPGRPAHAGTCHGQNESGPGSRRSPRPPAATAIGGRRGSSMALPPTRPRNAPLPPAPRPSMCWRKRRVVRLSARAGRSCRNRNRGTRPATGCRCARRDGRRNAAGRSCPIPRQASMTITQRACFAPWSRRAASAVQGAEHRVAVIGAAAAIELVAVEARQPRTVAIGPTDHLRLLVEMAIEGGSFPIPSPSTSMKISGVRPRRRTVSSVAPGIPAELGPRPGFEHRYRGVHMSVAQPNQGSNSGDLFGILM